MILVTGGTGLIGSHLLYDLLNLGLEVKVLVRDQSDRTKILKTFEFYSSQAVQLFNKIHWVTGDVTDRISLEEAFIDVDYVYHAAALVSFSKKLGKQIMKVNVEGTANIINLCLQQKVKKLCYVSSISSIVVPADGSIADEKLIWKPEKKSSQYSISKLKAEMEVWRGITEGLNVVIVNPSIVLGPGDWTNGSSGFFKMVANGIPFYTPGSNGFIDVRDVTQTMIQLMNSDVQAERFILNSENLSYKELFHKIDISMDKRNHRIHLPYIFARLALMIEQIYVFIIPADPAFSKSLIDIAYKKNQYSSEKIRKFINVDFRSIDDTVNELVSIFNKSKNNYKKY